MVQKRRCDGGLRWGGWGGGGDASIFVVALWVSRAVGESKVMDDFLYFCERYLSAPCYVNKCVRFP